MATLEEPILPERAQRLLELSRNPPPAYLAFLQHVRAGLPDEVALQLAVGHRPRSLREALQWIQESRGLPRLPDVHWAEASFGGQRWLITVHQRRAVIEELPQDQRRRESQDAGVDLRQAWKDAIRYLKPVHAVMTDAAKRINAAVVDNAMKVRRGRREPAAADLSSALKNAIRDHLPTVYRDLSDLEVIDFICAPNSDARNGVRRLAEMTLRFVCVETGASANKVLKVGQHNRRSWYQRKS